MADYSLYLVTGRHLLSHGKVYAQALEEALQGGVTVVQVREKDLDTLEFLEIARQSKALCEKYKVPLIINDRIDIALAVQADGVHLGQTDMPVHVARSLLPPGALIGVSCNNVEHVKQAVHDGADYIGIGAVWSTTTKRLTSPVVGVRGVGTLLDALDASNIRTVAIGGISSSNLLRTLHGAISSSGRRLDGVAVVSDIFASPDPFSAAKRLRDIISLHNNHVLQQRSLTEVPSRYTPDGIKSGIINIMRLIRESSPLVHQITNVVVTNQSANATLALGASPIMATAPEEMYDLSRIPGALLINFGTVKDKEGMILAGQFANDAKKPVVFDPVGVGATQFRKTTAAELLGTWQASVIKGNAGELAALAESNEVQSKGVDSVGSGFADSASFVKALARKERCIVVLTGPTDWISDGDIVVRLDNGDKMLASITGSGCMVGTCIATFCAGANLTDTGDDGVSNMFAKGDMLLGAIGGVVALTLAAEAAAGRKDVFGSGTFLPALIDELSRLTSDTVRDKANIQVL
ncbi:Hydroxyethylthiazole kinase family-domain-containing protein [Hygrophoropsis aurantiaca]|uniref:Hydroxyethylthiazole kinase family-domain-containing protein n=1 Tax=Hygrophoropsis aurantiaca TaxID=72124 RepID=A0ACB8A5E2_9AGAM|nr:Hydroxyethylthiazole kinase family-domain-containing protein [Hygrophoropsis aurantiaca]